MFASPCAYVQVNGIGGRLTTDYFPTNLTGFRLKGVATASTSGATPILGERDTSSTALSNQKLVVWTSGNKLATNFGKTDSGYLSGATMTLGQEWTFEMVPDGITSGTMLVKFNGATILTYTKAQIGEFQSVTPISIGTICTSASKTHDNRFFNGLRILEFDITENGVVQRKYRPYSSHGNGILVDADGKDILLPYIGIQAYIPGPAVS